MSVDKIVRCQFCDSTYVSDSPAEEGVCRYCGVSFIKKEDSLVKEFSSTKELANLILGVSVIIYFGMGVMQFSAIMSGLEHWGFNLFFRIVFGFIAYIPVVGTIAGIIGAYKGWGWSLLSAIGLFSLFPLLLSITSFSLTNIVPKFFNRWERLPVSVRWVLVFPLAGGSCCIVGYLLSLIFISIGFSKLPVLVGAPILSFIFICLCKIFSPSHKLRVVKAIIQYRFFFIPMLIFVFSLDVSNGKALNWKDDYSVLIGEVLVFIVYRGYFLSLPIELGPTVSREIFSKKFSIALIGLSIVGFFLILFLRKSIN